EKDPAPHLTARQEQAVQVLSSNKAPFRRYPECFLALVGLSPYYPFGENTYPAFEGPDRTVLFAWGLRRRLSKRADVTGSFLPNLLNTPPSFRGRGCGEGDLFFLSLLNTLVCGDGLREYLSPCLLLGAMSVLDSE
ncbi:hypothetical protein Tco_0249448, partial [Tanacetum coccineum]